MMPDLELTEKLLADIAGWDVMKQARNLVANDRVLSGKWSPPVLKGVVQTEGGTLCAGLVIKSKVDVENLCPCRPSREWGTMCLHSIGVGLRVLKGEARADLQSSPKKDSANTDVSPAVKRSQLRRDIDHQNPNLLLWVVFPPNWKRQIEAGKLSLFFEAERGGKRQPLNSIPLDSSYQVTEQDDRLLERIERLCEGELPAMWPFPLPAIGEVLEGLADHPRVFVGRKERLEILSKPWVPELSIHLDQQGEIQVEAKVDASSLTWIPSARLFVAEGARIQAIGLPARLAAVLQGRLQLNRHQVPEFLQTIAPLLDENPKWKTNLTLESFELEPARPEILASFEGGLAQLRARLQCRYAQSVFTLGGTGSHEEVWIPDPASVYRYTTRDLGGERRAVERLLRHGFRGPDDAGWYELRGQDVVLDFFAKAYPLLCRQWTVSLDERLQRSTERTLERIHPEVLIQGSGMQWLDFKVDYTSEAGTRFSDSEIQQWLLSGRSHRKLASGKVAMLDIEALEEFQEVVRDCDPHQDGGRYRIDAQQAAFLDSSVRELGWELQGGTDWRRRLSTLSCDQMAVPPLGALDSVLRDYQKQGVAWLEFLRGAELGGILADEMGLGKTLQVLALLQSHRRSSSSSASRAPALVICPTSLVFNWVNESRRFTPDLRILPVQGSQRKEQFSKIANQDIVVTSYALIRRDLAHYQAHTFDAVILDEAQHIKNRQTQNAMAVKSLKGQFRMVLTGTPMENSVLDLWSIFDFLMPGYLGSAGDFRDRYEIPIVREKSQETMARLGRRLRPFVLRRTKREVAPELPEKLEQTVRCPLSSEQREVYSQVMDVSRRDLLTGVAERSGPSRMKVLSALLRLRQICCDLRLLKLPEAPREVSGKMAALEELLEQALDGDHRVLVFSQFVSMLHLIREQLETRGIDFCYLDGSTIDRGAEVARFQTTNIPVFLISLKAGGVGLNLTGADTVIHFDPWWNPAIEDQATGRAHRIGQTQVVNSYKLITENTIEEKILHLQERKREIIDGTLGNEAQFSESLSWDDFQSLFEGD